METNSVVIIGRLTRDPELKYTPGGMAILNGSIANNRRVKQGEQWVDQASFFDFSYFGKGGEAVAKYLTKGKQIAITGELRQDRWQKDGEQKSKVYIFVTNIELLGSKGEGKAEPAKGNEQPDFQDDIPF